MGDVVRDLMHELYQRGPGMQKLRAEPPSWKRDMSKIFGQKVRSDA